MTPPNHTEPAGRRWRLLVVIVATAGALILAEGIVRLFDLGPTFGAVQYQTFQLSDNPVLQYELEPGAEQGMVRINGQGMRGPEVAVDKPAGTFRLASLGDSIGFGYGSDESSCYPRLLETYLNQFYARADLRFEVLNFGVTGYNITQTVEVLSSKAPAYDPDLILLGYCLNDAQDYSFELEQLQSQLSTAQNDYRRRLSRAGQRVALRSRLYALARYALDSRSLPGRSRGQARPEPEWAALRQNRELVYFGGLHQPGGGWERVATGLAQVGDLSREREIPAFVAVFPLFVGLRDYALGGIHEKVENAAVQNGLRPIPLLLLYTQLAQAGAAGFAHDELHPSALGHAYAAMTILDSLLKAGALPVPDRDLRRVLESGGVEAELAQQVLALTPTRAH